MDLSPYKSTKQTNTNHHTIPNFTVNMPTPFGSKSFVFVVALHCLIMIACAVSEEDDLQLYTLHVHDDMSNGACVTRVKCTKFWNKLWPGQEFHYSDLRKSSVICDAMWNDKDAVFKGFDPIRDKDIKDVYISIRADGFHLSYDQSKWSNIATWHD